MGKYLDSIRVFFSEASDAYREDGLTGVRDWYDSYLESGEEPLGPDEEPGLPDDFYMGPMGSCSLGVRKMREDAAESPEEQVLDSDYEEFWED